LGSSAAQEDAVHPAIHPAMHEPSREELHVDASHAGGVLIPGEEPAYNDEDACCAICFESQLQFVSLPCACKINYCSSCWDRALATSVTMRGHAQCPSCRSAFRIDFEPTAGGLVFSIDAEGTSAGDWRARLYGKAKPVQIQLLRDYGQSLASGRPALPGLLPQPPLEGCGACGSEAYAAAAPCESAGDVAARPPFQPECVCGARLVRVTARRRVERMLDDTDASWRARAPEVERLVDRLLSSSIVTCDLCDEIATRSGAVWTCTNGPHTVLHPAAYDVCEGCFCVHAGAASAAGAARALPAAAEAQAEAAAQSCCHRGVAAVVRALASQRPPPIVARESSRTPSTGHSATSMLFVGMRWW